MHTFAQLRKIERKYGDRVIIVGVHSPKFPAERETANLREAVLRYRIEHPVVNDRDFQVWQRFGGRAWPTLMFLDPQGRVIGKHEGELPFEQFDPLVEGMLKEFEEGSGAAGRADGSGTSASFREPGGVCAGAKGPNVADTNNHRVAFADWATGSVRTLIGD